MIKQATTRKTATLIAVLLGLGMGSAHAQSESDVVEVSAANNAFYAALSALDAAAMEKVWAHEPYVTSIGPANKAVTTGWVALQDGYKSFMARMAPTITQVMNKPVDTQVHINGNVAWVVGRETYERTMKDGYVKCWRRLHDQCVRKEGGTLAHGLAPCPTGAAIAFAIRSVFGVTIQAGDVIMSTDPAD